jgi:hypothetical protein
VEVGSLEYWENESELLHRVGLDDILDGSPAPHEGERLEPSRWENVIRRCLRDVAWLELESQRRFLVHFGYDLRLIIATDTDVDAAIADTKADGLFVYEGDSRLATLDRWRGLEA